MTTTLFSRVLVGVDGSSAGFVALDQGRRLLAPGGELVAVVVCQERLAVHAGLDAPRLAHEIHAEAEATATRARADIAELPGGHVEVLHGHATQQLRRRAQEMDATVIVVGSHSHSRFAGVVLGSVATELLHEAATAVLVARPAAEPDAFPRRILAGADGSGQSMRAVTVARELGARFGVATSVIVAEGGKEVDAVRLIGLGPLARDRRPPVDALLARAVEADLLVVGSRGLHGLSTIGSVSERVAHHASCSVLVLRGETACVSRCREAAEVEVA